MAIRPCQRGLPSANSLQANALAYLLAHRIADRYSLLKILNTKYKARIQVEFL